MLRPVSLGRKLSLTLDVPRFMAASKVLGEETVSGVNGASGQSGGKAGEK